MSLLCFILIFFGAVGKHFDLVIWIKERIWINEMTWNKERTWKRTYIGFKMGLKVFQRKSSLVQDETRKP